MSKIKYPDQYERLKKMRKISQVTALQAAELVHTDLRNWQRWEAGENLVPEAVVELFCIKKNLEYKDFLKPKSQAQQERELKRKEKFEEYKAKISGSSDAHAIEDGAFEKIDEVEIERAKLRNKVKNHGH